MPENDLIAPMDSTFQNPSAAHLHHSVHIGTIWSNDSPRNHYRMGPAPDVSRACAFQPRATSGVHRCHGEARLRFASGCSGCRNTGRRVPRRSSDRGYSSPSSSA